MTGNKAFNPRKRGFFAVTLALAMLFSPTTVSAQSPKPTCKAPTTLVSADEKVEAEVLRLLNAERVARKLPPLKLARTLTQSARRHSLDMAKRNFFDHTGSDKSDMALRVIEACYMFRSAAENIAAGYAGDVKAMVAGWMASPGHRDAILNPDFVHAGVGYATNNDTVLEHYWTLNFGQPLPPRKKV